MMGLSVQRAPSLDLPARFMGLSVASFATAVLLSPWALPLMQEHFSAFRLLAYVHLVTLGFAGAMIFGASYQLVPVVLQTPLASVTLGRLSFWCYLAGLATFLAGLWRGWLPGLGIGGSMLAVAFTIYIGVVFTTFLRAPYHEVIGWHIVAGLASAGTGMILGVLLAFNKSNGMLGDHFPGFLAAHIAMMLAGWVGITFTGVAYRLVCMFTLAEKHFRPTWAWAELALAGGGAWLVALRFALDLPSIAGQAGALGVLAGHIVFAAHLRLLYAKRMRRTFDIHIPFAVAAVAAAIGAAAMLATGLIRHLGPTDPWWVATVWLTLFGVAGTAIQGFFYKISTFLVWLKRYSPVAGRQPVPKLEQLYSRTLALAGWGLWLLGIGAGVAVILTEGDAMPLVGVLLLAAGACFVINVIGIARHWLRGDRLTLREPVVPGRARPSKG
jgi:hypothetical protein